MSFTANGIDYAKERAYHLGFSSHPQRVTSTAKQPCSCTTCAEPGKETALPTTKQYPAQRSLQAVENQQPWLDSNFASGSSAAFASYEDDWQIQQWGQRQAFEIVRASQQNFDFRTKERNVNTSNVLSTLQRLRSRYGLGSGSGNSSSGYGNSGSGNSGNSGSGSGTYGDWWIENGYGFGHVARGK